MISEERLEEIIKNKGVVWVYSTYSKPYRILPITFDGEREINSHTFCLNWNVKNIFETKEDAEFYVEFSCIERTERLELPNWEEKNCIIYTFYSPIKKGGKEYEFRLFKGGNITIWRTNDMYKVFNESATKENYTIACRKAKELFLGE